MASGTPSSPATNQLVTNAETTLTQRRIRHVTTIQIRNLTPFPVRDAFASALTKPAEQPQFSSHGHLSDDLDVTVSRKRSRKISSTSAVTHGSLWSDEGVGEDGFQTGGIGERGRKSSTSRVSFSTGAGSRGRPYSASGSTPTVRPYRRRTSSSTSHLPGPSTPASVSSGGLLSPFAAMLPDNSQMGLEKVINSRLVETFLTIYVPRPPTPAGTPSSGHMLRSPSTPIASAGDSASTSTSKGMTLTSKGMKGADNTPNRKGTKAPPISPLDKSAIRPRRELPVSGKLPSSSKATINKSASTSTSRLNGKINGMHTFPSPRKPSPPPPPPPTPPPPHEPNYISPICRPSTNPSFTIDAKTNYCFSEGVDLSADKMKVEVWGRLSQWVNDANFQRKGKEKEVEPSGDADEEWKILDEWLVDLADLVPLSDELAMHPSQLPSNTPLITLSPPGETFCLPSYHPIRIRSPSPSMGYASDPELEVRKVKQSGDIVDGSTDQDGGTVIQTRRRHRVDFRSNDPTSVAKTANWQDLFKLITLQSCILDNETSLHEVVRGVDKILEGDTTSILRREVSERQARLEELIINRRKVVEESDQLRYEIRSRRDTLRQQRATLTLAREQHRKALDARVETEEVLLQDRAQHLSLRAHLGPIRTTLLTILSTIFPIELLSPPDLLYTIIDVPLPIPVNSSDPGPPLTVSTHKDINEDTVATSLGYAAQVVQLLAAYLGKGLVYPVTCVGSRSLIRDGISAMVGPRMFPLFSKGVDTYRFEYAVFLLNKDIEMLMADRDLRALDMRHTLPNLKNLLLTLTDGEGVSLRRPLPPSPAMSLASDLEPASPRANSPAIDHDTHTPKVTSTSDLPAVEGNTPPASGSVTPTVDVSRKPRAFLGFSPFTDLLRSRYPSTTRTSGKSAPSILEDPQGTDEGRTTGIEERNDTDEEEDCKTIHGDTDSGPRELGKLPVHDGAVCSMESGVEHQEKVGDGSHLASHTVSVP